MGAYAYLGSAGLSCNLVVLLCTLFILFNFTFRRRKLLSAARIRTSNIVNSFVIAAVLFNIVFYSAVIQEDDVSNEIYTLYILQQLFFYTAFGGLCASWAPVVTTAADERRNTFTLKQKVIAAFCMGLTILSFLIIIKCAKMGNLGDFFNNRYFLAFLVISLMQDIIYAIMLFAIGIRFYVKFKDHVNLNFCAPNNNSSDSSEFIIQAGYNKLCRMLLVIAICSALRFIYYCLGIFTS